MNALSPHRPLHVRAAGWLVKMNDRWGAHRLGHFGFKKVDHCTTRKGEPFRVRLWDAPGNNPAGPTVIVMHGIGSNSTDSGKVLRTLLPDSARVIGVDAPGHGGSSILGTHYGPPPTTLYRCLDDLNDLTTEALDTALQTDPIDRPVVMIGHSLGGYEAMHYALATRRPANVTKELLISPDGGPFTPVELQKLRDTLDMADSRHKAVNAAKELWPGHPFKAHLMAPFLRAIFSKPEMRFLLHSDILQPVMTPEQLVKLPPVSLFWGTREEAQTRGCFDYLRAYLPPGSTVIQPQDVAHGEFPETPPALMQPLLEQLNTKDVV